MWVSADQSGVCRHNEISQTVRIIALVKEIQSVVLSRRDLRENHNKTLTHKQKDNIINRMSYG